MKCKRILGENADVACPEPAVAIAHYRSPFGFVDMPLCELHFLEAQPPVYDWISPVDGTSMKRAKP